MKTRHASLIGVGLVRAVITASLRAAAALQTLPAKARIIDYHLKPAEVPVGMDKNLATQERIVGRAGQEKCDAPAFPGDTLVAANNFGFTKPNEPSMEIP